jgi:hypothetical protein
MKEKGDGCGSVSVEEHLVLFMILRGKNLIK